MKKIVIIDYNIGNLQSVQAAFYDWDKETVISRDLEDIRKADALILPGVGAFPTAMNNFKKSLIWLNLYKNELLLEYQYWEFV